MLVLTRKPNQQLHIGNDIVITVVKVRGNTIRLGIEAPKDVRVIRSELEPKELGSGELEIQSLGGNASPAGADANAQAAEADEQPEADAAASSGAAQLAVKVPQPVSAQQSVDAQITAARMVLPETRSTAASPGAVGLKRFTTAMRSQGARGQRNFEDCPLCHRASQESAAQRAKASRPLSVQA